MFFVVVGTVDDKDRFKRRVDVPDDAKEGDVEILLAKAIEVITAEFADAYPPDLAALIDGREWVQPELGFSFRSAGEEVLQK